MKKLSKIPEFKPKVGRIPFVTKEELGNHLRNLFLNIKLEIENSFSRMDFFIKELEDVRNNIATLSSVLYSKNLFSKEELKSCMKEVSTSFGKTNPDGSMDGKVTITDYNFK